MVDYSDFVFDTEAIEIFKKIFFSCTAKEDVLKVTEPFFKMRSSVSLEDTRRYIRTGSETIFAYKLFNSGKIITIEDVIMAFSGEPHWKKMEKIYDFRINDSWVKLFPIEEYLISHIIKPAYIINGNSDFAIMSYYQNLFPLQFLGIQSFNPIDKYLVKLIHFGLVIYQTDNVDLINKIIKSQQNLLDTKNPKRIFYTQQELVGICERNIAFYNSLKT